jgi:acyltransferase
MVFSPPDETMTETKTPKTYFPWMNTLRGLGIVLVIFGHQKPSPEVLNYLQSVMLSLFIFSSGFLFSGDRHPSAGVYFRKRARGLLIPYAWFTLLSLLFWVLFSGGVKALIGVEGVPDAAGALALQNAEAFTTSSGQLRPVVVIAAFLLPALYANASLLWFNIPLWFFPGLFIIDVIFYWLQKETRTARGLLAALIGFSILGFLIGRTPFRLPWNIDTACSIVLYYGLGFMLRRRFGGGWALATWMQLLIGIIAFAISVVVIAANFGAHPSFNQQNNYFLYHLGALSSILAFLMAAQLLAKLNRPPDAPGPRIVNKALSTIPAAFDFIGRNSVVYVGAQVMTMGFFMTFNRFAFGVLAKEKLPSTLWALYFGIGAMVLLVPLAMAIDRWAPFMLGRPRRPKN